MSNFFNKIGTRGGIRTPDIFGVSETLLPLSYSCASIILKQFDPLIKLYLGAVTIVNL